MKNLRIFLTRCVYAPNAPRVGMPLLSRRKSTSQSITCAQVSQSIDNDLVD